MKIGYARISTIEQNLDLQIDALQKAGCEKIIKDEMSGSLSKRPGLDKLKEIIRKGDEVIVWRLDRLGRSLKDLISLINEFEGLGVYFHSLTESIKTNNATGKLIFHIFSSLSEFERNLLLERSRAGMEAARARGRIGGRPEKLDKARKRMAVDLYKGKKHSLAQICSALKISKPTLYKYVRAEN